jgi:type I restriction enzyme S subunit
MPVGWRTKKLGKLLRVQNGFAFNSDNFSETEGMPLIRIRDLRNGARTTIRYVGEFEKQYIVCAGDLLIGMDGEFRCYKWTGEDCLLNQRVCKLTDFSDEIDPEFVAFGIDSHLKQIEDATPFATVKHLSSKTIDGIDFCYPDRNEQRRIVSRVKESLERLEEIERLRQKATYEAQALLPSFLNEVFESLTNEAPIITIDKVVKETRYGTSQKCHTELRGTPILRIPNVAQGFVNFEGLKYCELREADRKRLRLVGGDLLFVRTNGSRDLVGRCAIFPVESPDQEFGFASYLIRVRVDTSKLLPRYLAYFLNSTNGRAEIDKRRRTSAGQFNINSENLRSIPFPVPSIIEQKRLVEQMELREGLAIQLVSELLQAATESKPMREAILHKAFGGEL